MCGCSSARGGRSGGSDAQRRWRNRGTHGPSGVTARPNLVRRYPALGFLVAAAVMAGLLPSSLLVPFSGPSASAELAPVPGRSNGAGDMSALGASSTGGLGSGDGLGSRGTGGTPPDPPPPQHRGSGGNPTNKRCVGNPPRQTEDPLSPICVAFFDGDNGGATAKGVTGDEFRIVIDTCSSASGVPDEFIDYNTDDPDRNPVITAYAKHFESRYQTYKRRAHFFEARWGLCYDDVPQRREQVLRIDEMFDPFAVVNVFPPAGGPGAVDQLAQLGIVTLIDSPAREFMRSRAPYVYSINPDLEDYAAMSAEFLCRRLAGGRARHSGDLADRGRTRTFGLVYDKPNDKQRLGARLLIDEVRRRCGSTASVKDYGAGAVSPQMNADRITTVVNMTEHIFEFVDAERMGWHPEWYVPGADEFPAYSPAMPASQWSNAFGFLFSRRLGAKAEQAAYVAAEEGCGGCGQYADPYLYDRLVLLFWGIQAAGPRLTPGNFDRGLHSLPARRSMDPYLPAAYLSPGNYSWIKDAMAMWWDPSGRPPGVSSLGCFRLVEAGLRYRAEDWKTKPGDEGIKGQDGTDQPCQGR